MSLAIDVDAVKAVLLPDGWHLVDENEKGVSTFGMDAYEVIWYGSEERRQNGEPIDTWQPKDSTTGFHFIENGQHILGPMTSVLAFRLWRT